MYQGARFTVIAITDAPRNDAEQFALRFGVNFPILYDAASDRRNFGVRFIWGSTFYLVDPGGTIVASGLDRCEEALSELQTRSQLAK